MKPNSTKKNSEMKREYDFSKAVRGKFYRKNARLRLPIYLDAKIQERLQRLARKNGKALDVIVNQMVQKEMELLEELT
jgi:cytidylate kinase